jgi:heme oxygenase
MSYTQSDLKQQTQNLHASAEQTQLSQDLISGTIDPNIYKTLLWQLYLITDAIETRYYFQDTGLCRKHLILHDIALLPPSSLFTCKATDRYLEHLWPLSYHSFKGHIYTHYLGWLYGGQIIAKRSKMPSQHLHFNDVKSKIQYIRNSILANISQEDINEAQLAFRYTIDIYKELYELHRVG